MKNLIVYALVGSCTLTSIVTRILANQPLPRPAFMPSTPPASKAITSYSAADLVGAVATREFPSDHPFSAVKSFKALKAEWPGAKNATQIDAMVQIVLEAPAATESREINTAFENVRYVIQEVMDVPDSDRSDAFVRLVNAQTDPLKKRRATGFAWSMFAELLDVRLLGFEKELLDDATEYTEQYRMAEGKPRRKSSIRTDAKRSILFTLKDTLQMTIDETPFQTSEEASNCAALKAWLADNWALINSKCIELKARPERQKPTVGVQVWDARW